MTAIAPRLEPTTAERTFEFLYRRYATDVYRYTLALLRNPADAEDLTQTTFMNAYRALQRGEVPRKPHHWLLVIAHNACRSRYARAGRRVQEVPLDETQELSVPEEERPDVHGVLQALSELPFNQRSALVMRELEGRTYAQIAETLGVTQSAVEALIFRARRALRLRSSALRSLGAVQLPASLAGYLDNPGALVGGGAAVGTGLLAKAALVLLLGATAGGAGVPVDTGVAQGTPAQPAASQTFSGNDLLQMTWLPLPSGHGVVLPLRLGEPLVAAGIPGAEVEQQADVTATPSAARDSSGGSASSPSSSQATTTPVQKTVNSVDSALPVPVPESPVALPTVTVPPLPVSVPQTPPVPTPAVTTPTVTTPTVTLPGLP